MIETLKTTMGGALERLAQQIGNNLPLMLAALMILLLAALLARLARWLITRAFKGIEVDQWLRRSGVSAMIDRSGTLRTSRLVAQSVYWAILLAGAGAALNVFGTQVTTGIAERVMLLVPRLVVAGVIVLAGFWIGQYAARGALIWAVNEDLPAARKLAWAVRALVVFAAIVIAADAVNFAAGIFLAAFILILGGVVLAASLALGLGAREAVQRHFSERGSREAADHEHAPSVWNHL